ncbi:MULTISPECIES: chemoreceptor glutamine deamidase CheD [Pseudomonas syringae group]|uniref:Probable chemoreceptor glutamine deamidase CheD n=9 Tax=Pseudomonas syringae group TaxID=136849 RepID=CHED_PSESM|nr:MULTISPECIES: chemoreceptor glutamine deamidase CheD [Pseudomonas syringae group]Q888V7.1 RecName: Full=Probable chemoreceptor glutamine deamidase CheD [Pseudomonas syringae pv. tomato str. DC3000]KPC05161.1 putative chemoreceptor glutamine deamidase CheD [Pseudomonas amygdali pv. lachrymans]AAO54443.1 chemotaxis protein CheD, putative [Pseudomonas syringae pv. tomato str. DC3000]AVI83182.1 chemoreceptor glutamine deamidase CheD [Pseudomonas syringae pv. tomato]EEB58647.1 chemotaxis protein
MRKPVGAIEIVLAPGEVVFETRPARLRTLLGSCVAITFWHPQQHIGGMCHFMLPHRPHKHKALDGRYGDEALEMLIRHALANHTKPRDYQVKLFGGGQMFPEQQNDSQQLNVADLNVHAALAMAERHRLQLKAQDMGRTGHRTIIFDLWDGNVWVKHQPIEVTEKDAR